MTRHFDNYAALNAALDSGAFRFLPQFGPASFQCADCGPRPLETSGNACGTGYAIYGDDTMICYACADARQRAELLDRSGPFSCYVSSDGRTVTTWTGGKLGDVVSSSLGGGFGDRMLHVRVRDVHGGLWHGKGAGAGMSIRLRAMKGAGR
jgi:hypothetical protein